METITLSDVASDFVRLVRFFLKWRDSNTRMRMATGAPIEIPIMTGSVKKVEAREEGLGEEAGEGDGVKEKLKMLAGRSL